MAMLWWISYFLKLLERNTKKLKSKVKAFSKILKVEFSSSHIHNICLKWPLFLIQDQEDKWYLVLHSIDLPLIKIEDNQVVIDLNSNNILKPNNLDNRCNNLILCKCKWILCNKWDTLQDNLKIITSNKDKDIHLNNNNSLVLILKCLSNKPSLILWLLFNNNLIHLINSKIMLQLSNAWMNLINSKLKYKETFWEIS